jgi:hypothetical protein
VNRPARTDGLAFLTRIASVVCEDHGFHATWSHTDDEYILIVHCGHRELRFPFPTHVIDDPSSDEYRLAVEAMLDRLSLASREKKT